MTDKQRLFWENFADQNKEERLKFLLQLEKQQATEAKIKAFCLELEECVRRLIAEVKEIT
jgi:hypothetical protein